MLRKLFEVEPQIFAFGPTAIKQVGIVSGGAAHEIKQAVEQGLDAFVTGEVREPVFHFAREERIHFIAAGHHATERFGVRALGEYVAQKFGLEHQYVEIKNPV